MGSTVAVLLLLSAGLFTVGFGDDCRSYITSNNEYKASISCGFGQYCCGTCDNRYCCFIPYLKLTQHEQNMCNIGVAAIVSGIMGIVFICVVFIVCFCCPSCWIYQMCRTPRPVPGAHITTVVNTQSIQQQQQQPVIQPVLYPAYQPVPTQPGYGAQPMQTGPYPGQPYAPGPPPPYHMAANPGYPSVQAPNDVSQVTYPMMPPAQPGLGYPPPGKFDQLA
ncbi:protein shisa-4-like [Siphateles boraxobius]|uniref:protein shisa-4-like n=1 Tax=Siphateles boraxobius TaxID=180520 RepID=UPI0040635B01